MVTLIGWYLVVLFGLGLIIQVVNGVKNAGEVLGFLFNGAGLASGLYLLVVL